MEIEMTEGARQAVEAAAAGERRARVWRRYQALLLLAQGQRPATVAQSLGCSRSSVYGWAAAWRQGGVGALRGQPHGGGVVPLAVRAGALVEEVVASDPQARGHQATGWTAPLLQAELAAAGYVVSQRTIRRTLHRLGYRWKRPKYVLGRPDPHYAEKRGRSSPPPRP